MGNPGWAVAVLATALAACSPQQAVAPPVGQSKASLPATVALTEDAPPPLTDGLYIGHGACPGEGCNFGAHIRAWDETTLVDGTGKDARTIGAIMPQEWVKVLETQERVVPVRAVLGKEVDGLDGLKAGDVVYRLGYEGEGCSTVYRRGKEYSWCDVSDGSQPEQIAWEQDAIPQDLLDRQGFFVQVRRADGQEGWLGKGNGFGCTGDIDRTRDCDRVAGDPPAPVLPNDVDQVYGHEGLEPAPWAYEDGLYSERKVCPGDDCYLSGKIRAISPVDLVARSERSAPVADRVEAGEWVWILAWEYRVPPTPGVVKAARDNLKVGDKVYALGRAQAGCTVIFHGAFEKAIWCGAVGGNPPGADFVEWAKPATFEAGKAGLWVLVKSKSNGQPGWVREADLGKFACVSLKARDRECPPATLPPDVSQVY